MFGSAGLFRIYGIAFLFVLFACPSFCQQTDTTIHFAGPPDTAHHALATPGARPVANADSLAFALRPHPFQPNPKKAGLYSSIVPGLGQLYNRQYWKIPVVYLGLGIAGYYIIKNSNDYQSYRLAYIGRINNPYPTDKYVKTYPNTSQLQQLQADSKKYLDLSVLFTGLGYLLQVFDAVTSAHLKNFDISRDISLNVTPSIQPGGGAICLVLSKR